MITFIICTLIFLFAIVVSFWWSVFVFLLKAVAWLVVKAWPIMLLIFLFWIVEVIG